VKALAPFGVRWQSEAATALWISVTRLVKLIQSGVAVPQSRDFAAALQNGPIGMFAK